LGEYAGGGLFEIAFSLDESGEHDEAKKVYEYLIELSGETSAAMNNLAIIYEKKGDLIKAREYIKKAKSLLGEASDEIIDRNYARLIQHSKRQSNAAKNPKREQRKSQKTFPCFNLQSGEIELGNKKCEIPISSNQYYLCKAIFDKPLGDWTKETDVVSNFFRDVDSRRGFYDAMRLVNTKVKADIGIEKMLEFKAAAVRIRKEIFE